MSRFYLAECNGNDNKADDTGSNYKPAAIGHKLDIKTVKEVLWWILLFVIMAVSMRQR